MTGLIHTAEGDDEGHGVIRRGTELDGRIQRDQTEAHIERTLFGAGANTM